MSIPDPPLIALRLPPGPAFAAALERAWGRGQAVLPLDPAVPAAELRRLLRQLRPAAVVDADGTTRLPAAEPVAPGVALVVATSGSTGAPKGVALTAAALEASTRASLRRIGASAADRWLCCLPLSHIGGLQVLLRARLLGASCVLHPRFDPAAVAAEPAVTHISLVPTMLRRLLDAGVDVGRFERILLGGAAPPPGLLERAAAAGARVVTTYGMTETGGGCVYDGVALDGVDVAVGTDDARAGDDGQAREGHIRIRGPVLFHAYRRRPDLTTTALRGGWFHTGDLGRLHPDGRLEVCGRSDDIIVTGGVNVAAAEVAALLTEHPSVADAAVVGRPDREWGERVVAVVVPHGRPPTLAALRAFVRERAAAPKAPRELVVVEQLPRLATGKLDRPALLAAVEHG